jgi:hypothetical protein
MTDITQAPNPVLTLKTIRLHIEQKNITQALDALKLYGELYAAYALAEVAKAMDKTITKSKVQGEK